MNKISAIQPNNLFRVNPVALNGRQGNPFDSGLFEKQTNESFNLNHPKAHGNGVQANFLDILA